MHVVQIGAGAIGSHLVGHVARMEQVNRLTIVDHQRYETNNLAGQDITPDDIGRWKAVAQLRRARRLNPRLDARAVTESVEKIPLGWLRGDLILGCVDSRRTRMYLNEAAWRLGGVALIDAGVEATGSLLRVNVYQPSADAPCLECAWDGRDYAALEQAYPCAPNGDEPPATAASSWLGAAAAAWQAAEIRKMLFGNKDTALVGRQVVVDLQHHRHMVTAFKRHPRCRFDHQVWQLEGRIRSNVSLGDLANDGHGAIRVPGQNFLLRLVCPACGFERPLLRLNASLGPADRRCQRCGGEGVTAGFDQQEEVRLESLGPKERLRKLRAIGFRPGDIFKSGLGRYEVES